MENFETKPKTRQELLDDIILGACEMQEFQQAVEQSKNPMEGIKNLRELLREHFPEISEIPELQDGKTNPCNEFVIAKEIFRLLHKK